MSGSLQRSGQTPARSAKSFNQTCRMFAWYLKEKGGFGDLTLGIPCNGQVVKDFGAESPRPTPTTAMDLFPVVSDKNFDLFEGRGRADSSLSAKPVSAEPPQVGQMTVFYGGQVIVIDGLAPEKAREIIKLASIGTPPCNCNNSASTMSSSSSCAGLPFPPTPTWKKHVSCSGNHICQEHIQPPSWHIGLRLPMARRASLYRFLEKRKDRLTAKAPYKKGKPAAGRAS